MNGFIGGHWGKSDPKSVEEPFFNRPGRSDQQFATSCNSRDSALSRNLPGHAPEVAQLLSPNTLGVGRRMRRLLGQRTGDFHNALFRPSPTEFQIGSSHTILEGPFLGTLGPLADQCS